MFLLLMFHNFLCEIAGEYLNTLYVLISLITYFQPLRTGAFDGLLFVFHP